MTREQLRKIALDVVHMQDVETPHILYCAECGRILLRDRYTVMQGTKGVCDCSWRCCKASQERVHPAHLCYRPQDEPDATGENVPCAGEERP